MIMTIVGFACCCFIHFCSLTSCVVLLQEKLLLDLPKLLDICAIYGHENEDLTRVLVSEHQKWWCVSCLVVL